MLGALLVALGATGGLLAILAPGPLSPDVAGRLLAAEAISADQVSADEFAVIYQTRVAVHPGRWRRIHVRHSNAPGGSAASLAEAARQQGMAGPPDHFVIGNGQGAGDGEVQFTPRWDEQQPAAPPVPGAALPADAVSICVVGDFDAGAPTPWQTARLRGLIASLRARLSLGDGAVFVTPAQDSPLGLGVRFPTSALDGL